MHPEPREVTKLKISRRLLFGYDPLTVDRLLEDIADSYERLWHENESHRERIAALELEIAAVAEQERTIGRRLIDAELMSQKLVESAERRASHIVGSARRHAQTLVKRATAELRRLEAREADALARVRSLTDGLSALAAAYATAHDPPVAPERVARPPSGLDSRDVVLARAWEPVAAAARNTRSSEDASRNSPRVEPVA
jgi:cell division septum initiation protein DivIVA